MSATASVFAEFEESPVASPATDSSHRPTPSSHVEGKYSSRVISADIVPDTMRSCWYALKDSGLSDDVFSELMNCAVYASQHSGMKALSVQSVSDFLSFWKQINRVADPTLSVTPGGGIALEWFKAPEEVLAVMFPGNRSAIFNLFDGGAEIDGIQPRASFNEMVTMLTSRRENPFLWIEEIA